MVPQSKKTVNYFTVFFYIVILIKLSGNKSFEFIGSGFLLPGLILAFTDLLDTIGCSGLSGFLGSGFGFLGFG